MDAVRLLIVDDEPPLLELLRRYLERMGYEVDTATGPHEALAKYQAQPERYDLVVTDLSLDEINGEQLLERMRALNPSVRGLITSGYPHQPQLAGVGFLQKPFLPKMLAEAVEKAIRSKR